MLVYMGDPDLPSISRPSHFRRAIFGTSSGGLYGP